MASQAVRVAMAFKAVIATASPDLRCATGRRVAQCSASAAAMKDREDNEENPFRLMHRSIMLQDSSLQRRCLDHPHRPSDRVHRST